LPLGPEPRYSSRTVPRWLHVLLIAFVVATTCGLPAVVAAADSIGDCAGEEAKTTCPEDDGTCPPSCHGCTCRPHFGPAAAPELDLRVADVEAPSFTVAERMHRAPPLRGVFHPPRLSA
jgi:hypothetical protein